MELPVHRRKARSACFIQDDENQTPDEPGPSNCAELPPIGAPTTVEPQHALQLENLPKNSNDFTSNIFIPHFNQSFSIPAPACKETTHSCTDADEYSMRHFSISSFIHLIKCYSVIVLRGVSSPRAHYSQFLGGR